MLESFVSVFGSPHGIVNIYSEVADSVPLLVSLGDLVSSNAPVRTGHVRDLVCVVGSAHVRIVITSYILVPSLPSMRVRVQSAGCGSGMGSSGCRDSSPDETVGEPGVVYKCWAQAQDGQVGQDQVDDRSFCIAEMRSRSLPLW